MTSPLRRLGAALVLATALATVTACAQDTEAAPGPTTPAPVASSPTPEPTASATTAPVDPTCETIIPETTVADFESVGWTYAQEPFLIGATEVPDGIMCRWADFEGPAGDHLQFFGWASIDGAAAEDAQSALIGEGWVREDAPEGVYITENPDTTITVDEEGYGMTYLFTPGAVELADTKQGLLLVEWPKG